MLYNYLTKLMLAGIVGIVGTLIMYLEREREREKEREREN